MFVCIYICACILKLRYSIYKEYPTLDFSSGGDLTVRETEPHTGLCADGVEPTWDSLSAPPPLAHSQCSLPQNKLKKK